MAKIKKESVMTDEEIDKVFSNVRELLGINEVLINYRSIRLDRLKGVG
jgi:hypothetical protein